MLVIRCAACGKKLWKYEKIGPGEVLRCHRDRITKIYFLREEEGIIRCRCGRAVGHDRGRYIKMVGRAFTSRGTKRAG